MVKATEDSASSKDPERSTINAKCMVSTGVVDSPLETERRTVKRKSSDSIDDDTLELFTALRNPKKTVSINLNIPKSPLPVSLDRPFLKELDIALQRHTDLIMKSVKEEVKKKQDEIQDIADKLDGLVTKVDHIMNIVKDEVIKKPAENFKIRDTTDKVARELTEIKDLSNNLKCDYSELENLRHKLKEAEKQREEAVVREKKLGYMVSSLEKSKSSALQELDSCKKSSQAQLQQEISKAAKATKEQNELFCTRLKNLDDLYQMNSEAVNAKNQELLTTIQQLEAEIAKIRPGYNNSKNGETCPAKEPFQKISFEESESDSLLAQNNIIRQPSLSHVLAEVKDLVPALPEQVTETECSVEKSSANEIVCSGTPMEFHFPTKMLDQFIELVSPNTKSNLETCGFLNGSIASGKIYVTLLIIPKQESTSDMCQATDDLGVFNVQMERSVTPLGWIHTHPSQTCFLSSVDIHTQYSHQKMLPEAVAIVVAPNDTSRKIGIFRLTPGGISSIGNCNLRGHHEHDPLPDGAPIYESCTDVVMDSNLAFEVVDLRS